MQNKLYLIGLKVRGNMVEGSVIKYPNSQSAYRRAEKKYGAAVKDDDHFIQWPFAVELDSFGCTVQGTLVE